MNLLDVCVQANPVTYVTHSEKLEANNQLLNILYRLLEFQKKLIDYSNIT